MFLKVATSNNTSLQFFKFAGGRLLGFEDKFNRMKSLFLCGASPRIKVQLLMRFFISMRTACSQVVQTLSQVLGQL
jgi:hypothetical protein